MSGTKGHVLLGGDNGRHGSTGQGGTHFGYKSGEPGQGDDGGGRGPVGRVAVHHALQQREDGRRKASGPSDGPGDNACVEMRRGGAKKGENACQGGEEDDTEGVDVGGARVIGPFAKELGGGICCDVTLVRDPRAARVARVGEHDLRPRQIGEHRTAALRVSEKDCANVNPAQDNTVHVAVGDGRGDLQNRAAGQRQGHGPAHAQHRGEVAALGGRQDDEAPRRLPGSRDDVVGHHACGVRVRQAAQQSIHGRLALGEARRRLGRFEHQRQDHRWLLRRRPQNDAPAKGRAANGNRVDDKVAIAFHVGQDNTTLRRAPPLCTARRQCFFRGGPPCAAARPDGGRDSSGIGCGKDSSDGGGSIGLGCGRDSSDGLGGSCGLRGSGGGGRVSA